MAKFFVYQKGQEIIIDSKTQRELNDFSLEMLRSFNTIQDCRRWVGKWHSTKPVTDRVKSKYTGISPESKAKTSAWKKLLASRSNYWKKSEATKKKISQTMKGTRVGSLNPNFGKLGKKRKPSTKYKMSLQRKGIKWCVDTEGKEHRRKPDFTLPPGWSWGRNSRTWDRI